MVRIRLRENGPIVIEADDVTIVDWNGQPYEISRMPVALCRCGGSSTKPFCDGSHKRNGFQGGEVAPPSTTALPASSDDGKGSSR
jgi:CDGSH-type Zn-finger protein